MKLFWIPAVMSLLILSPAPRAQEPTKGVRLEQLSWKDAEQVLTAQSVVVLPIGAALTQHGPHLALRTDLTLAEYFADRLVTGAAVVGVPALGYHHHPGAQEYPGSASLSLETARDATLQVVRSLARSGPRRFYALNTGKATIPALEAAATALAREGILLRYTDWPGTMEQAGGRLKQQEGGWLADEIETSLMLYVDPAAVVMDRAVKEYVPSPAGSPLTRRRGGDGVHSASGVAGDPTLARREKGLYLANAVTTALLRDIDDLRTAPLPAPQAPAPTPRSAPMRPDVPFDRVADSQCVPGVERDLKRVEAAYNTHWRNRDAPALAGLWSDGGDIAHPDGRVWKGKETIRIALEEQFKTREYRAARHSLTMGVIRCINTRVAVVDAKWDLRDVASAGGELLPRTDGLATLVLQGGSGVWLIEAYRYHVTPGAPPVPTWLKKPGYPDKR